MIDLDGLEEHLKEIIDDGRGDERCTKAKNVMLLVERLRQAEKCAARYRWLRDLPEGSAHEEIGNYPGDMWDSAIDEAMQCK